MKLTLTAFLAIVCKFTFGQKTSQIMLPPPVLGMGYPEFISACDLPTHKKELVYTRFIYSGVDEYWGLYPEKNCNNINADLDIPDNVVIKPEYLKQFKDVHEQYWEKYLIVDVIGTFEDTNISKYGHLGSNNSKFTVKDIIDVYTVNKIKLINEMKPILQEISVSAIQLHKSVFTDKQKDSGWLGSLPASTEEIKSAENRLGIELPDDYKNFLLITNGFFTPNDSIEPTFETVDNIDYLKNIDPFLLEVWNQGVLVDIGEQLNRAIVIGGINDEQYFFLIPPDSSNTKWQYWKFANWIPGEERFDNLENYFTSVLDFMKNISPKRH